MLRSLEAKGITYSETPDRRNLKISFQIKAVVDILISVEKTGIGKITEAETRTVDS